MEIVEMPLLTEWELGGVGIRVGSSCFRLYFSVL